MSSQPNAELVGVVLFTMVRPWLIEQGLLTLSPVENEAVVIEQSEPTAVMMLEEVAA